MALTKTRLTSHKIPYIAIRVVIANKSKATFAGQALVDTGFDGDVIIPSTSLTNGYQPAWYTSVELANGSIQAVPVYTGTVSIGSTQPKPARILLLGDMLTIGLGYCVTVKLLSITAKP